MGDAIVNRVAESGLITLDLAEFSPTSEIVLFDLKDYLFMEMILKEREFREALKKIDWEIYRDKYVGVVCSADAIIPVWSYMLVAAYLQAVARDVVMGDEREVHKTVFLKNILNINPVEYADKRIVVKGCGDTPIGEFAYLEITKLLRPVAKTIMYGEPCSTVPIYKAPQK